MELKPAETLGEFSMLLAAKAFGTFVLGGILTTGTVCLMCIMLVVHIVFKPLKDLFFPPRYPAKLR